MVFEFDEENESIDLVAYAPAKDGAFSETGLRNAFLSQAVLQEGVASEDRTKVESYLMNEYTLEKDLKERRSNTIPDASVYASKKYKPAALKVKPIYAELPAKYRIVRDIKGDPLAELPKLNPNPPAFEPTGRYTQERKEIIDDKHDTNFLWPEEIKLVHHLMMEQEHAFAWQDTERGKFREDFFPPVVMPTVEHEPWTLKNIPIPKGIFNEVCKVIKSKLDSGVYERSSSPYRSRWFTVAKKEKDKFRIVHSLEPLNSVTIAHSGVPPATEELCEHYSGRACGGMFDLYVGYDERLLAEESRDYTTFQSPYGALRLVTLPMGWTNSVPIFHEDVSAILRDEIPEVTRPYIDDVPVRGPATRYELKGGGYETIPENNQIRRFVWEHINNVNRVLQRIKYSGATFSGYKTIICAAEIEVLGHMCSYDGRKPTDTRLAAVMNWPPCKNVSEVRGFIGTVGVLRSYIPNFALRGEHLQKLVKQNVEFEWGPDQEKSMEALKEGAKNAYALKPIDYEGQGNVVLAVDSSYIAIGFYIYQEDILDPKKRYYVRFGSITMHEREARFSQPKRELFGLKKALEANKMILFGCRKLVVETDAKYISGMLANPDLMPNATINRWIEEICMFHFTIRHVAGKTFGPDGLSRKPYAEGNIVFPEEAYDGDMTSPLKVEIVDPDGQPLIPIMDFVDQIDNRGGYFMGIAGSIECFKQELLEADNMRIGEKQRLDMFLSVHQGKISAEQGTVYTQLLNQLVLPADKDIEKLALLYPEEQRSRGAIEQDRKLVWIREWLNNRRFQPPGLTAKGQKKFVRLAQRFVMYKERLYRRGASSQHRLFVEKNKRMYMMSAAHDHVGHRGFYATSQLLIKRFWWPEMEVDINWYIKTCQPCQERQQTLLKIKPTLTFTPSIFQIVHVDVMNMTPASNGCNKIVHGRDNMTHWVEARAIRKETGHTIGLWIFEDLVCRWACLIRMVTDNGGPFLAAARWLREKYGFEAISISPYNSQAQGAIEKAHWDVRNMLYKCLGESNIVKWYWFLAYVLWADRVTIRKRFGCAPFFLLTGAEPVLPLDVKEATWLVEPPVGPLTETELIGLRARALAKHKVHVENMRTRIDKEKYERLLRYERDNKAVIKDYTFKPGDLVLVRNTQVEKSLDKKMKARYLGPMIVIARSSRGAYVLAEMNGAVWQHKVAAFRVVPYYAREKIDMPSNLQDLIDISAAGLRIILDKEEDEDLDYEDIVLDSIKLSKDEPVDIDEE
jgi:hypothetical protein